MSSQQITLVALAAVLGFWAVGAYNRLMGLRNAILRGFVPVDLQLKLRHALLQRQIDTLTPVLADHADSLSALRAASTQALAAGAHARTHPGAAGAINSLRLAESILLDTRARLPPAEHAGPELAELNTQLASLETTLQFARAGFNDAVMEYNRSVQQFPTWVLARLFGFRVASAF